MYSLEGKKASVNRDGAEREELKLMKPCETSLLAGSDSSSSSLRIHLKSVTTLGGGGVA